MSIVTDQTSYTFSINVADNNGNGDSGGSFTLASAAGVDDETALAIYQALQEAPWSMDTVVRISVYKADDVQTISMPDLTQTPPAFT